MRLNNMSKTYHGAGYGRLSKEDAEVAGSESMRSNSIENQKEYIEEFLKTKPEIVTVDFYMDDGYSGVHFERPSFQKMMQDIIEKKIDCIIVKDLSRFGRNYIEVGKYIEQLFPMLGVRFIAINDNYDSLEDAANNSMILPFKNLINDAYCRDISVKIRSHLDVKRRRGEFIGAFAVYGYKRGADRNRLAVDTYAAEIVKDIFHMKMDGMSNQAIADELNGLGVLSPAEYKKEQGSSYKTVFQTHGKAKWTTMAIIRILSNEVYVGTLVQGKESTPNYKIKTRERKPQEEWVRVENAHEAIISRADYEVVADIMKKDTRVSVGKKTVSLYSGYLCCADCGCSMVRMKVSNGGKSYTYYVCSGYKNGKAHCSSHRINENMLNAAVTETVRIHMKYLADLQEGISTIGEVASHFDGIRAIDLQSEKRREEIEKYKTLRLECYEDYKSGLITREEYHMFRENLQEREGEAESAIRELEKKKRSLTDGRLERGRWKKGIPQIKELLDYGKMELLRSVLVRLVDRIYVYEDRRIEIMFRYQDEVAGIVEMMQKGERNILPEDVG